MFERSEHFKIDQLNGKILDQVCIGLYQVTLRFEGDSSISCGSKLYIFNNDTSSKQLLFPPPSLSVSLLDLLGKSIEAIDLRENESLKIVFQGGIALELERDNEGYESFEIWIGKDFLIA